MSRTLSLRGVFPPIPTPFARSGQIDYGALAENLQRWNRYDLCGYVVLGSNGEASYLTDREKVRLLEAARQSIPPEKVMIAGTGCESTRQTIALTRQAARVGADAALVLTPFYYGGQMSSECLVQHFFAVAESSPLPVLLYNVPKFTHVDMDAATIARAASHPNIIGLKDSGGNMAKFASIVRLTGPDFSLLAGSAGFFFPALTLGAVGGVLALANVAPQQCLDIYRHFRAGRWEEAADLQRRMIPLNAAVTDTYGVAGLKAALDMLGYYGGPVRAPLLELGPEQRQALAKTLAQSGFLA